MDLLAELVYVLSQNLPREFDDALPGSSKLRRLFDLVAQGAVRTDEEAAMLIYEASSKDKRYLMLKRNLVNKLVDLVLDMTPAVPQHTYEEARSQCLQRLIVSEKLLQQNVYHNAERILAKVLQMAERYHLLDIQVACMRQSRLIYALKGFPPETEASQQALALLLPRFEAELMLEGKMLLLQSKIKFFLSYQPELLEEAKAGAQAGQQAIAEAESPFVRLYAVVLQTLASRLGTEWEPWQAALHDWQALVRQHRMLRTPAWRLALHLEWARYYRASGAWAKAEKQVQQCLEVAEYAAFNQFEVMALAFEIQLQQGRLDEAGAIVREVHQTAQFELLNPIDVSAWGIRSLYLFFLYQTQRDENALQAYLGHIDGRNAAMQFLNVKQPVSKDKRGYNLQLVMLRLFFQLLFDAQADLPAEGNKMMVYYQRHVKAIEHTRTGSFFKSLAKAAMNGMSQAYLERRTPKLLARLADLRLTAGYDACECVPYETLWKLLQDHYGRAG